MTNRGPIVCPIDESPVSTAGSRNRVRLDRTQYQEAQMDKWAYMAAAIPGAGAFAWALVRFFDWRRKLRMREESL